MIEIKQSSRFKKDLKRYKHQKDKLKALAKVLGILKMGAKRVSRFFVLMGWK